MQYKYKCGLLLTSYSTLKAKCRKKFDFFYLVVARETPLSSSSCDEATNEPRKVKDGTE